MPEIAYAEKMAQKSNCFVLDVSDDDPATTHGCTSVMLNLLNYVPKISPCGEVGIKTEVFGDQGLVEKSRKATFSRTEEKAGQRLSSLVSLPSDNIINDPPLLSEILVDLQASTLLLFSVSS